MRWNRTLVPLTIISEVNRKDRQRLVLKVSHTLRSRGLPRRYFLTENFVGGNIPRRKLFVGDDFRHQAKISSLFPEEKKLKIEIYIFCVTLEKLFFWKNSSRILFVRKNHSSGKIIRREQSFVGKNHSSGNIIRREKLFVRKNYSSGKIIRREKGFTGKNICRGKCLSGKIIRREKLFVGENYSSPSQNLVTFPR